MIYISLTIRKWRTILHVIICNNSYSYRWLYSLKYIPSYNQYYIKYSFFSEGINQINSSTDKSKTTQVKGENILLWLKKKKTNYKINWGKGYLTQIVNIR